MREEWHGKTWSWWVILRKLYPRWHLRGSFLPYLQIQVVCSFSLTESQEWSLTLWITVPRETVFPVCWLVSLSCCFPQTNPLSFFTLLCTRGIWPLCVVPCVSTAFQCVAGLISGRHHQEIGSWEERKVEVFLPVSFLPQAKALVCLHPCPWCMPSVVVPTHQGCCNTVSFPSLPPLQTQGWQGFPRDLRWVS